MKKKIEELCQYVLDCRDDDELPPFPGAVLLTTDEPVSFDAHADNPFVGLLKVESEEGALRVLDGQHRLLAISALLASTELDATALAAIRTLQIPAVLFAGLRAPAIVEMFVTINAKHTKLNPSLLLSLNGRQLHADETEGHIHDIIKWLNDREGSALAGEIKMLGVGEGRVAQSGLAQELRRAMAILRERLGEERYRQFIGYAPQFYGSYFDETRDSFPDAWGQKGYSTHSLQALRAVIQASVPVVEAVFARGGDPRVTIAALLAPWRTVVGSARFQTAGLWRERAAGGGKETTRRLSRELIDALAGSEPNA